MPGRKSPAKWRWAHYDGNATDGTEINGLGFEPEYVIIKQDNAKEAVHRPDSLGGDNTLWFKNESQSADMIQELQSDGFQIGLDDNVNARARPISGRPLPVRI